MGNPSHIKIASCHPERRHFARGVCSGCYKRWNEARHPGRMAAYQALSRRRKGIPVRKLGRSSATCHPERILWAHGMCRICWGKKYRAETRSHRAALQKAWRKNNKERYSALLRRRMLRRKFGLDEQIYAQMLMEQNGVCAICHGQEYRKRKGVVLSLAVDHDHSTGKVRGLICSDCNTGLARFRDNPGSLFRAIQYLARVMEKTG